MLLTVRHHSRHHQQQRTRILEHFQLADDVQELSVNATRRVRVLVVMEMTMGVVGLGVVLSMVLRVVSWVQG